jgi:protein-S-isoprenylcysteine O-methyltransferase Ste14
MTVPIALFCAASLLLALLTHRSVVKIGSHGFFRFLAWEAMLGLILLNAKPWFADPFRPRQIASWIFLSISSVLALMGYFRLRGAGRPGKGRTEPELVGFEKTTHLVDTGVYGVIRHPMYASLICLAAGIFLKQASLPAAGLTLASATFLALAAFVEEKECSDHFGEEYRKYMKRTKRFIPFIF